MNLDMSESGLCHFLRLSLAVAFLLQRYKHVLFQKPQGASLEFQSVYSAHMPVKHLNCKYDLRPC